MKKLFCFTWLMLFCVIAHSAPQNAVETISLVQPNERDILVEIDLRGVVFETMGKVTLPKELQPYLRESGGSPKLLFQLIIADQGSYRAECTITDQTGKHVAKSYPAPELIRLSEPYRIRDVRGIDLEVSPILVKDGRSVCPERMEIRLINDDPSAGRSQTKLNPYFIDIYRRQFSNFSYRYEDIGEYGTMAVICPPEFLEMISPWAEWKTQKGIPTTVYSTALSGNSYEATKAFIQDLYDSDPLLTFVQLVGDYAQIPCVVNGSGTHSGGRDADFTLLSGDDWYPDIFVGRFSAETEADLYTQVWRSLDYEREYTSGDWLSRAAGVCSDLPPQAGDDGEHNWEHLDNIRGRLLSFGFSSVDRIYGNEGAGTQDLRDCINEGKSLINYCGEGYPTYWVTPRFYVNDALALTNTEMLPFIHSVACHVGQFYNGTCLAEAFLRARDPVTGAARGAIAIYAAAPSQGIAMPMRAQDHSMDLLTDGSKNTIGGLCYNGSSNMLDVYGEEGGDYNFYGWNLFGDCSLVLRTRTADPIPASLPDRVSPGTTQFVLQTGREGIQAALTCEGCILASAFSDAAGAVTLNWTEPLVSGDRLLLTLSGFNCIPLQHDVYCVANDQLLILSSMAESGIPLEPGIVMQRTVTLHNAGGIAAVNVRAELVSEDPDFIPVLTHREIASLAPGADAELSLSYKVALDADDLSSLEYSLMITSQDFSQSFDHAEIIHTPELQILSVVRDPQPNWINPGDRFEVVCAVTNDGSATLRDLSCVLESHSTGLIIDNAVAEVHALGVGAIDSLRFTVHEAGEPGKDTELESLLRFTSQNAPEKELSQTWRTVREGVAQESFESGDLHSFPWDAMPQQWQVVPGGYDGFYSLNAEGIGTQSPTASLSFISRDPGTVSFYYRKCGGASGFLWQVKLNGVPVLELPDAFTWTKQEIGVAEGPNFLSWEGSFGYDGVFGLDAIEFPARTVFSDTRLIAEPSQFEIVLGPGEILEVPLQISSSDGKYLEYTVMLGAQPASQKSLEIPSLVCDKAVFTPGSSEWLFFTLYNSLPAVKFNKIELELPEQTLATLASAFNMPGAGSLPFTGSLGNFTRLVWESEPGSQADSLRGGIRILSNSLSEQMDIGYVLSYETEAHEQHTRSGVIRLESSSTDPFCLSFTPADGEIYDQASHVVTLSANQNLHQDVQQSFSLDIYYNGNNVLHIPVSVVYEAEPDGFYDEEHLLCYPNPARSFTVFAYAVPLDGEIEMTVYNLRGQRVKTLVRSSLTKGYYRSTWDMRDAQGRKVTSGVYFCRLRSSSGQVKVLRFLVSRA